MLIRLVDCSMSEDTWRSMKTLQKTIIKDLNIVNLTKDINFYGVQW